MKIFKAFKNSIKTAGVVVFFIIACLILVLLVLHAYSLLKENRYKDVGHLPYSAEKTYSKYIDFSETYTIQYDGKHTRILSKNSRKEPLLILVGKYSNSDFDIFPKEVTVEILFKNVNKDYRTIFYNASLFDLIENQIKTSFDISSRDVAIKTHYGFPDDTSSSIYIDNKQILLVDGFVSRDDVVIYEDLNAIYISIKYHKQIFTLQKYKINGKDVRLLFEKADF